MTYREPYSIIIFGVNAAVAQSVVRRIGSAEVTGPIPVSSFKIKALYFSGTHEKPHKYRVFRYIIKRNRSNQST